MKKIIVILCSAFLLTCVCLIRENDIFADEDVYDDNFKESVYEIGKKDVDIEVDYLSESNIIEEEVVEEKAKEISNALDQYEYETLFDEMLNREKEDRALYLAALDYGIEITEIEVDQIVDEIKSSIEGTENEEILKSYIRGAGLSEEEYWEKIRDKYKKNLYISKYLEIIGCDSNEDIECVAQEKITEYDIK